MGVSRITFQSNQVIDTKRAFNLLGGVNQGCEFLLARGLEKRQPVALVNTPKKIESLRQGITNFAKTAPPVDLSNSIKLAARSKLEIADDP